MSTEYGPYWLDSALFIGGKCSLFNGSGKSPGLNQFAFCELGRDCLQDSSEEIVGDFFLFCTKHSHIWLLQTFPAGRVRRFRGDEDIE
jgi:hypothetical protein